MALIWLSNRCSATDERIAEFEGFHEKFLMQKFSIEFLVRRSG